MRPSCFKRAIPANAISRGVCVLLLAVVAVAGTTLACLPLRVANQPGESFACIAPQTAGSQIDEVSGRNNLLGTTIDPSTAAGFSGSTHLFNEHLDLMTQLEQGGTLATLPDLPSAEPVTSDPASAINARGALIPVPDPGISAWDPLESTCRHASLSIL